MRRQRTKLQISPQSDKYSWHDGRPSVLILYISAWLSRYLNSEHYMKQKCIHYYKINYNMWLVNSEQHYKDKHDKYRQCLHSHLFTFLNMR